jgi:hypothetical protein
MFHMEVLVNKCIPVNKYLHTGHPISLLCQSTNSCLSVSIPVRTFAPTEIPTDIQLSINLLMLIDEQYTKLTIIRGGINYNLSVISVISYS